MLPTPTPLPDMSINSPVQIPEMSLWTFVPDAIQVWNSSSRVTDLFAIVILLGIFIGGFFLIMRMIRQLTRDSDD